MPKLLQSKSRREEASFISIISTGLSCWISNIFGFRSGCTAAENGCRNFRCKTENRTLMLCNNYPRSFDPVASTARNIPLSPIYAVTARPGFTSEIKLRSFAAAIVERTDHFSRQLNCQFQESFSSCRHKLPDTRST